jgi:hypothetical protein
VWKGSTPFQRSKILVHEVFHIVQFELGAADLAPNWLLEGSAEYVGYSAVIARGLVSREKANEVQGLAGGLRGLAMRSTLQSLETQEAFLESNLVRREPTVSLSYAAVELLVAASGLRSLRTFFSALRPGVNWKTVFKKAFGTGAGAFYDKVARLRVS